jgi:hypothetical protein
MGSTSTTIREIVALTSPAEVSTPSAVRRGESALVSVTGGEVVTPSAIPRVGVAVRASSASASHTACGSGDLVREGDDGATGTPCGLATGLHDKILRQVRVQIKSIKIASALKVIPRHSRKLSLRPKHPRLNSHRYLRLRHRSTALRFQTTSENFL